MQMKTSLFITVMLFALSSGQIFMNWGNSKVTVLQVMFIVVGVISFVLLFMIVIDMTRKDFTKVQGTVVSRHRNQVWVKLDNGKHKSSVISANQNPENFREGQTVEMTLGRRSKLVHRVE